MFWYRHLLVVSTCACGPALKPSLLGLFTSCNQNTEAAVQQFVTTEQYTAQLNFNNFLPSNLTRREYFSPSLLSTRLGASGFNHADSCNCTNTLRHTCSTYLHAKPSKDKLVKLLNNVREPDMLLMTLEQLTGNNAINRELPAVRSL